MALWLGISERWLLIFYLVVRSIVSAVHGVSERWLLIFYVVVRRVVSAVGIGLVNGTSLLPHTWISSSAAGVLAAYGFA